MATSKLAKAFSTHWPVLVLVIAGLGLRVYGLEARGLWLDELVSMKVATRSLAEILTGVGFDRHTPPLYYLVLHGWLQLVPVTELGIRSLSVLVDTCNILCCYLVFSPWLSRRVGISCAGLYALSPFAIYYAQEGRMYPLVVLLSLLACFLTWRACSHTRPRGTLLWLAVVAACGLYTHYYFTLLLCLLACAAIVTLWRRWRALGAYLGALGVAGLCFVPWIGTMLDLAARGGQYYRSFTTLVLPYTVFRFLSGYAIMPLDAAAKADPFGAIVENLEIIAPLIVLAAAIAALGIVELSRHHRSSLPVIVLPLIGVPIAAVLLSLWAPMASERYLVIVYPLFLAVVASALWGETGRTSSHHRSMAVLRVAVVCLWGWALVWHCCSTTFGPMQLREATRYICAHADLDEPIVVVPGYYAGVVHYYAPEYTTIQGLGPRWFDTSAGPPLQVAARSFWLVRAGLDADAKLPGVTRRFIAAHRQSFPVGDGVEVVHFVKRWRSDT